MKSLQNTAVIVGVAAGAICPAVVDTLGMPLGAAMAADSNAVPPLTFSSISDAINGRAPSLSHDAQPAAEPVRQQATLEPDRDYFSFEDYPVTPAEPMRAARDVSYLAYYAYSEIPPAERPADIALAALKDVSPGTPIEEIRRASEAFGLDFNFMKTVAKIESDFDPGERTGSYIGLFQLSRYEFNLYGAGEITNARDNAVAAAYKFVTEATLFELDRHRSPSFFELYLIHQQGWQGAAEHTAHPERIAWQSMCATDEGKEKGEQWCRRAIWQNTLPAVKEAAKSVDNLTSGDFMAMWRDRIDELYTRYSATAELETTGSITPDAKAHDEKSHAARSHAGKSRAAKAHGGKSRLAKAHGGKSHVAKANGGKSHLAKSQPEKTHGDKSHLAKSQPEKAHGGKAHLAKSQPEKASGGKSPAEKADSAKSQADKADSAKSRAGKSHSAETRVGKSKRHAGSA